MRYTPYVDQNIGLRLVEINPDTYTEAISRLDGIVASSSLDNPTSNPNLTLDYTLFNINPTRLRLFVSAKGNCNFHYTQQGTGDSLLLSAIVALVPHGWIIEDFEEIGAMPIFEFAGSVVWLVAIKDKLTAKHKLIPGSDRYHVIEAGESYCIDLIPIDLDDHQATEPTDIPVIDAEIKNRLEIVDGLSHAQYPVYEKALLLNTIKRSHKNYDMPLGQRTMGWYMYNRWKRFGYSQVPPDTGPYKWGSLKWASGDSNGHYDLPLQAVRQFVRTGNRDAWNLAYKLIRRKLAHGLIRKVNQAHMCYRMQYESTTNDRFDYLGPHESHMWIESILAVGYLSKDPHIIHDAYEIAKVFVNKRFNEPDMWQGGYGCRLAAWHLENLIHISKYIPDLNVADSARAKIEYWCSLSPNSVHWPESGTNNTWWPWQDGRLSYAILKAITTIPGLFISAENYNLVMARGIHAIEKGTRFIQTPIGEVLETSMASASDYRSHTYLGNGVLTATILPLIASLAGTDISRWRRYLSAARNAVAGCMFQNFSGVSATPAPQETDWGSSFWGPAITKNAGDSLLPTDYCFVQPA